MTEKYLSNGISKERADAIQRDVLDIAQEKGYKVNPNGQISGRTSATVNTIITTYAWILTKLYDIAMEDAIEMAIANFITHATLNLNPCIYVELREIGWRAFQMVFTHMTMNDIEMPGQETMPTKADWYAFFDQHNGATTPQAPQTTAPAKAPAKAEPPAKAPAKAPAKVETAKGKTATGESVDIIENWLKDPKVAQLSAILQGLPSDVISRAFVTAFFNKKCAKNTPQHYCADVAKLVAMLRGRFTGEE